MTASTRDERRPARTWRANLDGEPRKRDLGFSVQAASGVAVIVLVTVHMIANHFVVPGGLRDYAAVVDYLSNPLVVVLELAFLVTVSSHALAGLRAVLLDLGWSPRAERRMTRLLMALGVLTVGYGLLLTGLIVSRT